jgi:hypothetical protein
MSWGRESSAKNMETNITRGAIDIKQLDDENRQSFRVVKKFQSNQVASVRG